MHIRANIWHLIGRLNQRAADGVFPLGPFKPSSSDSADRGHSIIWVRSWWPVKWRKQGILDLLVKILHLIFYWKKILKYDNILYDIRRVWRYQRGNFNLYSELSCVLVMSILHLFLWFFYYIVELCGLFCFSFFIWIYSFLQHLEFLWLLLNLKMTVIFSYILVLTLFRTCQKFWVRT